MTGVTGVTDAVMLPLATRHVFVLPSRLLRPAGRTVCCGTLDNPARSEERGDVAASRRRQPPCRLHHMHRANLVFERGIDMPDGQFQGQRGHERLIYRLGIRRALLNLHRATPGVAVATPPVASEERHRGGMESVEAERYWYSKLSNFDQIRSVSEVRNTRAISKSVWGSLLRVPVTSMDPYGCIIAGNELGQVQGASFCSARSPSLRLASGCNGSSLHGLLRR